ncbi:MAG: AraC family transcriptional regulator, partial [Tannerella sp.]|nr:AraC family transcriptional regulator [Tannerella sp.]
INKITDLLNILEVMAISDEYEILASVGFTESVYSDDFNRFNKVYKYLVQNFTTPDVKLEDVSALIGLTPTAFCRYLKKRTKKTFVEYLNDMRLGHAKKLLIEGKMKISTVSLESGFNNLSNFINQFKRSTNMLPSDYQKKYGNKAKNML